MYQILVFDYNDMCFAKIYSDGEIEVVVEMQGTVFGKTKAGGQSAQRYARTRENQKKEWFKEINEFLMKQEGKFYVGCSQFYYNNFLKELHTYNKEKIIERRNCEYSTVTGIYQMVNKINAEKSKH